MKPESPDWTAAALAAGLPDRHGRDHVYFSTFSGRAHRPSAGAVDLAAACAAFSLVIYYWAIAVALPTRGDPGDDRRGRRARGGGPRTARHGRLTSTPRTRPVGRGSALGGDQDAEASAGHHHLDGGEPLVGQPPLAQRCRPGRRSSAATISHGVKSSRTTMPPGSTRSATASTPASSGTRGPGTAARRGPCRAASTSRRRAPRPAGRRRRSPARRWPASGRARRRGSGCRGVRRSAATPCRRRSRCRTRPSCRARVAASVASSRPVSLRQNET